MQGLTHRLCMFNLACQDLCSDKLLKQIPPSFGGHTVIYMHAWHWEVMQHTHSTYHLSKIRFGGSLLNLISSTEKHNNCYYVWCLPIQEICSVSSKLTFTCLTKQQQFTDKSLILVDYATNIYNWSQLNLSSLLNSFFSADMENTVISTNLVSYCSISSNPGFIHF